MFQCNEEGHVSYNCPTGPTRGRGGGRGGGGSTRPCFKVTFVTSVELVIEKLTFSKNISVQPRRAFILQLS